VVALKAPFPEIELVSIGENLFQRDSICNNYPSDDTSQLDQSRQDLDIIDEIFQPILENVPSKGTTLEQIRDSKPFSKLKIKVPLNFPKQHRKTFQEMLHQTWDKKSLVEHYLAELSAIDQTKVFDLQGHIQSEFRRLRGSDDHHIKIGDLQVIEQLSQQYIKGSHKRNGWIFAYPNHSCCR